MYSSLGNVQVIVSLLKKYDISNIVISAGTRHTPLVHSVENDIFFNCYSIVDERSASFFALGLIQQIQKPVAICCTSGTAACNYVSAAHEAFYQQLPLLILTADRNPYYLNQQEEQMVPQQNLFRDVCKKTVTLPIVRDDKDFWYCARLVNEALLELEHRDAGPVHVNFPVENDYPIHQGIVRFDVKQLPDIKKIERLALKDDDSRWKEWADRLRDKRVLVIYGQHAPLRLEQQKTIDDFSRKYNCVISVDHLSNLSCVKGLDTYLLMETISKETMQALCPDIVITMNGSSISKIKDRLQSINNKNFIHWHVSENGAVSDPFKCLPDIVECSPMIFFQRFAQFGDGCSEENSFYELWKEHLDKLAAKGSTLHFDIDFSSVYATQQLIKEMPKNSLFHIANSNSIRLASFFPLKNNISVYCNRGTNGIDGSMSSFIGQAYVSKKPSFLLIGDLSFFYDMNALWNRYVGNNIRILICNNSGGAIFHTYPGKSNIPTIDSHIAAEHTASVKEWAVSRGFSYLSARNKEEFEDALPHLMRVDSESPVILEVFTDKETDNIQKKRLIHYYREVTPKSIVASYLPRSMKEKIKRVIR